MVKSVMKEIFIILLLSVAILLILGILFYDYIPINRVIPEREAYVTPDNVLQEFSWNAYGRRYNAFLKSALTDDKD